MEKGRGRSLVQVDSFMDALCRRRGMESEIDKEDWWDIRTFPFWEGDTEKMA